MTYGTIKVDTVTFTDAGIDKSVTLSGLVQNPTFSGNVTVTGTLSGVTVTGTTANFTSGNFTNISGGTHTITSGVFAAGSAASPSITFTGDLNTGIYSPGADQVAISTGGSGRLFVDANGNVGIAGSPANYVGYPNLRLNGTSGGILDFSTNGTSVFRLTGDTGGAFYYTQNTSYPHVWGQASSERMRLTSTGLGVGTSSPSQSLDVNGNIRAGNGGYRAFGYYSDGTSPYNVTLGTIGNVGYLQAVNVGAPSELSIDGSPIKFRTGSGFSEAVRIDASGRVGIGTSSPTFQLDLKSSANSTFLHTQDSTGTYRAIYGVDSGGGVESAVCGTFSNHAFIFRTNNTERARIDTAGRLGIGTTSPTANRKLTLKSGGGDAGLSIVNTADDVVGLFVPENTTTSQELGIYSLSNMRLYTGGTQRATIDTSGRLLVGTSSARSQGGVTTRLQVENTNYDGLALAVNSNTSSETCPVIVMGRSRGTSLNSSTSVINNDRLAAIFFQGADGTDIESSAGAIECFVDGTPGANDMPGRLVFSTTADGASSPTERMRITNNGTMSAFASVGDAIIGATGSAAGSVATVFSLNHSATSTTTGSTCLYVFTNGDVRNTNNSYGAISDIKLKENIVDANSQWDDIKALQVRKYNFKQETGHQTHTQIGLVAQEVELVSPGLVTESPDRDAEGNDLGTVTKSVNYSVLYMKAVKALQEAMERIETLEAKVAALETK